MGSLKILDISFNQGLSLPRSLGNLCKLQALFLSGLDLSQDTAKSQQIFSGCIVQSLKVLELAETKLQGDIPYWVNSLKNLQWLNLYDNQINSTLPPWLFNLTSISFLDLSYNDFHGSIPSIIENMYLLEAIYLDFNSHLEGPIPMTLGNLCKLQTLSLEGVNISQNFQEFGGIFSGCIKNSLQSLNLGNISLRGAIPKSIGQLSNLAYLGLENNNLEGVLTQDHFANLQKLTTIDLSGNALTGPISSNINGTMSQLVTLSLSMNKINGMVPFTLCTLANTQVLDVSLNYLSGKLPNCWNNNSQFMVLDFSSNNISGGIPNSICSLQKLESLHLSNNSLSDVFPTSLRECHSLITLDLSYNNFFGSIPHWIAESMPNLQVLNLKFNKFSGYLPTQLSSLPKLHILDLSHNNLSGSIPRNFGDFSGMTLSKKMDGLEDFDYIVFSMGYMLLVIKGNEYKCKIILFLLNIMDLSCNNLHGSIPEELTNLSELESLNLSGNHLTGDITNKIGKMRELESLDLSRNNISGIIPPSLESMDFLQRLNLSYNNLSGQIPFEKHFTTFDDPYIYIGNLELCGPPLSINCSRDEVLTTPTSDVQEKDIWLHLGICSGFITGLWAVFIIMLFKRTWRVAYFRYVDNMCDRMYVAILVKFTILKRISRQI
ncbi:Non-specific serine/threonine protein kinase protein [Dioscorea alata]|uniref:Non-specific serine/threonine protein kinase protein n=1 Tax=Dioscorea alata TaxID=55571 RepID=A0ACB7WU61_DIOAL|nr:Non-specific serine/threonine protein kinase protein [Dioscorea alata]